MLFSSFEFTTSPELLADPNYAKLYWINFFFESLPIYLFFTYALMDGIIPLLLRKRYGLCLISTVCLVVLSLFSQELLSEIDLYLIQPFLFNFQSESPFSVGLVWTDLQNTNDWITFSFDFILVGFVATGIKLFNAWTIKQRENQQLERQKLQTDLQLLKLKLNPEFLFNSLKTLHNLTMYKPKQAPDVVLHLAHFLRYVLYESQTDTVPLIREVEIIEYYVSLQQAMYPAGLEVSLTIRGSLDRQTIVPLLLFPIVENAFRHLLAEQAEPRTGEPAWVSIDLVVTESNLTLKVINGPMNKLADNSSQLVDIQKQLYFHYADSYALQVDAEPDAYIVRLTLPFTLSRLASQSLNNPSILTRL